MDETRKKLEQEREANLLKLQQYQHKNQRLENRIKYSEITFKRLNYFYTNFLRKFHPEYYFAL